MRRRTALRALTITAATLAATATAAPAPAADPIRVGVGDQSAATFEQPAYRDLDLRQTRYFVRWDVMDRETDRLRLRTWVKAARASGSRPLIHVSTTDFTPKKAPRPSVRAYDREVGRLVAYLRRLGVRDFGAWNEANHKSQPTWDSPNHAALFFQALYRDVHRRCSTRTCRVVALDVLDQPGVERYIERFYDRLRTRTWITRAKVVGIHNYSDVNRDSRTRTRNIIKEVRSHTRGARFWFTETGGLVGFGANFPCDPSDPGPAERRAARAVRNVFDLARTYRSSGVQRIYLYNWFGNDCAPNDRTDDASRPADERAGFDAGLVRADGTERPGLGELRRALRSSTFAP